MVTRSAGYEALPGRNVCLHNRTFVDILQVYVRRAVRSSGCVDALPLLDPDTKRRKIHARWVDILTVHV